jgi:hypothetical protein
LLGLEENESFLKRWKKQREAGVTRVGVETNFSRVFATKLFEMLMKKVENYSNLTLSGGGESFSLLHYERGRWGVSRRENENSEKEAIVKEVPTSLLRKMRL